MFIQDVKPVKVSIGCRTDKFPYIVVDILCFCSYNNYVEGKIFKLEWHELKRQSTLRNRSLDFALAMEVFADPNVKEYVDNRRDYGELRVRAYGMCSGSCLRVVYTMRGDVHRIISIHKVHKKEQEKYYG